MTNEPRIMLKRLLSIAVCGLSCTLLCAEDTTSTVDRPAEKIVITEAQKADLPANGSLRMTNAIGELTIEAWDEPGMEITTIKSTKTAVDAKDRDAANKLLASVKVVTERKDQGLVISTTYPTHPKLARLFIGMTEFDLEYRIKVPRTTSLTIDEVMGEVHIDNIAGELHIMNHLGETTVRLPDGAYSIDARSKIGSVESDFPGTSRGLKWFVVRWPGQAFTSNALPAPQKIFLRAGFGDILILKQH